MGVAGHGQTDTTCCIIYHIFYSAVNNSLVVHLLIPDYLKAVHTVDTCYGILLLHGLWRSNSCLLLAKDCPWMDVDRQQLNKCNLHQWSLIPDSFWGYSSPDLVMLSWFRGLHWLFLWLFYTCLVLIAHWKCYISPRPSWNVLASGFFEKSSFFSWSMGRLRTYNCCHLKKILHSLK